MLALLPLCAAFIVTPPVGRLVTSPPRKISMQENPLNLPSAVVDILKENDLKDPSAMSKQELDTFLATTAAGAGLLFLLPLFPSGIADLLLSTLIGGGAAAYASLRKDAVGDAAQTVGENTLMAVDKVKDFEKENKVTETVKQKVDEVKKSLLG